MSTRPCPRCGTEAPHSHLPIHPPEVRAARLEDPAFAEVMGRARAKALRTEYRPEVHYPFRPVGKSVDRANPAHDERLAELLERWTRRGERPNPYLRAS